MKSLNRHEIIGRLGAEPKIHKTDAVTIATLSVATDESYFDKGSKQKKERTEWHTVVLFNQVANIASLAQKGSRVYVAGPKRTRSWKDKEGKEQFTVETIGNDFLVLDKLKPKDEADESEHEAYDEAEYPGQSSAQPEA